jgi:hypothetical protein
MENKSNDYSYFHHYDAGSCIHPIRFHPRHDGESLYAIQEVILNELTKDEPLELNVDFWFLDDEIRDWYFVNVEPNIFLAIWGRLQRLREKKLDILTKVEFRIRVAFEGRFLDKRLNRIVPQSRDYNWRTFDYVLHHRNMVVLARSHGKARDKEFKWFYDKFFYRYYAETFDPFADFCNNERMDSNLLELVYSYAIRDVSHLRTGK